ncbi:MAG: hypothetical protein E4H10_07750 [Bacteroidia bacterium]|nr:MAG: hypothetical protein E4H10_07750 [Bacteroidia bacterium]
MFDLADVLLEQCAPDALKASLTTRRPPRFSVIPFRKDKIAVFSLSGRKQDSSFFVSGGHGFAGGYLVEEAIPVNYDKTWEDRSPTPGECLLTLFHRKPDLEYDLFIKRWHEGHTPLSLKLHPLWNYNRNVVKKEITGQATWYDGIVEEQFKEGSHLLNPLVFFGPPVKVPKHMMQVLADTKSFIDMKRIETYLATEVHFLSNQQSTYS